jgi:predicted nucleic acid-binding protein
MNELADGLARPKLDRYLSLKTRQQFLLELGEIAQFVPIIQRIFVSAAIPETTNFWNWQ